MNQSFFFSKILLFGEYSIIKNSRGLTVPYRSYKGNLNTSSIVNKEIDSSHKKILEFVKYLKNLNQNLVEFNWQKLDNDLKENLYFNSNIPQGYGLGSSGALIAAVYEKYAMSKIIPSNYTTLKNIQTLKKIFSHMESYFHGNSSGFDPLVSYSDTSILIGPGNHISTTQIPSQKKNAKGAIFLVDSGVSRKTTSMISIFMEKMKSSKFSQIIFKDFIKFSENCIDNFLNENHDSFFRNIKILSSLVLQNFDKMIPKPIFQLWEEGINTDNYYLKLCGSGGGGYFLGFTKDFKSVKKLLKDYPLEVVYKL